MGRQLATGFSRWHSTRASRTKPSSTSSELGEAEYRLGRPVSGAMGHLEYLRAIAIQTGLTRADPYRPLGARGLEVDQPHHWNEECEYSHR